LTVTAAYITDMLAMTNDPGAAVAVVRNGEVVYQKRFGAPDRFPRFSLTRCAAMRGIAVGREHRAQQLGRGTISRNGG
jgi:hypothetical protein